MWFQSRTKALAPALALTSVLLAGCSDIYYDRRDGVSLASGEAMATNRVTHTIDPWPPASANRNIAYSGERMQGAAERYRSHRIIQPVSPLTSGQASQPQPPPALTTEAVPSSGQGGQSASGAGKP